MYGSTIWNPFLKKHINQLELVNHKYLRFVLNKLGYIMSYRDHDYSLISNFLKISNLSSARQRSDFIFLFKLFNKLIDCDELLSSFVLYKNNELLRKRNITFILPNFSNNILHHSVTYRLSNNFEEIKLYHLFNDSLNHALDSLNKLLIYEYYYLHLNVVYYTNDLLF